MSPSSPSPPPWPAAHDWSAAIQNPHIAFGDSFLKGAVPAVDRLGMPWVSSGNYAYVFKLVNGSTSRAVRCFGRYIGDRQQRYEAVSQHLDTVSLSAVVGFDYDSAGIRVNGTSYPILVMEWLQGDTLDVYLGQVITKPDVLSYLAVEWARLVAQLEAAHIAHGDLQHGNVLVCGAQLRLVDLDGMFVPPLQGRRALELGHRAYQHPERSASMFDDQIDRFSALVIYTSLRALAVKPGLWDKYHDENLIFTRQDYQRPRQSPAFKDCRSLGGEVGNLVDALTAACEGAPSAVPPLSNFVTTKPSKLPTWMHAAPPGSLTAAPKTREAGVGRPIASVDEGAGAVREPPAPVYVHCQPLAPPALGGRPTSTPQSGGTVTTASTYTASSTWGERFGAGFTKTFGALWWICVLTLFSGNGALILGVAGAVFLIAVVGGLSRAASGPRTAQQSHGATSSPPSHSRPSATTPRATWPTPTYPSPSGSPGGTVVASRIRSIYHRPSCEWALKMSRRNRIAFASTAEARQHGYRACRACSP